jgi:arylsulfatase A-like enzyme
MEDVMTESIDRRCFLRDVVLGSAALSMPSVLSSCARAGHLPNFVVIFTDDQGYADVGCFGARGFETPNLDRMAAEGMRFTDFYATQAVCSASRAALLTGCYANRIGIRGALGPRSQVGISDGELTIAEVLKQRGYVCGIFGKWHLGHHRMFLPLQHGFDEYFGLPYSNDMWPRDYLCNPVSEGRKAEYPPLPLIDGNEKVGEIETLEDQNTLTTLYTQRAVAFIEKHRTDPFFLYVPHSMPHVPLGVSEKFRGKSEQGMYGDVMMEIDWSVGQILQALEDNGVDRNTLVVFTSDNGPWLNFGNHAGSALPLREGKGTTWDGGQREPCIMRWPRRIRAGSECDKLATTMDLLPTFAALAGAPLPGHRIDGVNILPLLEGDPGANPRDHFFFYYTHPAGFQMQAVRQGKWKLHFPHNYRTLGGRPGGQGGLSVPYEQASTGLELYDLEKDIGETTDVADRYPQVVAHLQALAEQAREDLGDMEREGTGVRPVGRI